MNQDETLSFTVNAKPWYPMGRRRRLHIAGHKRRMMPIIKRQMCRRSAGEPVIARIKNGYSMDSNYLGGHQGDAINPVLASTATTSASSSTG